MQVTDRRRSNERGVLNVGMKNSGFSDEQKRMARLKNVYPKVMDECCKNIALELYRTAKKNTPVDSGTLKRGWVLTPPVREGLTFTAVVSNNVKYGPHVEYGHRLMRRDSKGTPHYYGYVAGQYFFHHAISQARRAQRDLLKAAMAQIKREVDGV